MSNKSVKKVDLEELLRRKQQGKMDKPAVSYYESEVLETSIEVRKIKLGRYMDLISSIEEDESDLEGLNRILYECCPIFKEAASKGAMEIYDVGEAIELPAAMLEEQMNEIKDIVEVINKFYGLDKVNEEKSKIKN